MMQTLKKVNRQMQQTGAMLLVLLVAASMILGSTIDRAFAQAPAATPAVMLVQAATPTPPSISVDERPTEPVATPTSIPEGDVEGALGIVTQIIKAGQDKNWNLLASLVLMLLVFLVRNYLWTRITKEWLPITTAGMATATYVSGALFTGAPLTSAVIQGLAVGVGTIGLWELFKAVKRLIKGEPKEPV